MVSTVGGIDVSVTDGRVQSFTSVVRYRNMAISCNTWVRERSLRTSSTELSGGQDLSPQACPCVCGGIRVRTSGWGSHSVQQNGSIQTLAGPMRHSIIDTYCKLVGSGVGELNNAGVGELVGAGVGEQVGAGVGELVGAGVGELVGAALGELVGAGVGELVGAGVGELVGAGVGELECANLLTATPTV